ncbi:helix-turn-helix domain-containing protein [Massilia scottii]|uniref:helix-turn-helix domain-containing protein n=1 Tax=Massilia scottii TaxID=3057166 RepID=UPI002796A866|nr:helix-turn-helix transcriptional regulator [Massilia sp. CCM 9029]MDQ1832768.1 helix-turn-helix transcriptional regulator [Massilia sp. CCM 9029]
MKSIHDPRYCEFIERLIEARLDQKITQTQLAELLGKPQSYVAKVENLDRRIDVVEMRDWLVAMRLAPGNFMAQVPWWNFSNSKISTE